MNNYTLIVYRDYFQDDRNERGWTDFCNVYSSLTFDELTEEIRRNKTEERTIQLEQKYPYSINSYMVLVNGIHLPIWHGDNIQHEEGTVFDANTITVTDRIEYESNIVNNIFEKIKIDFDLEDQKKASEAKARNKHAAELKQKQETQKQAILDKLTPQEKAILGL